MRDQTRPSGDRSPLSGSDWRAGSPLNTDRVESWDVSPRELRGRLDLGEPIVLIDIREPWETEIAAIPGARHIPLNELRYRAFEEIDPEDEVVLYCHVGALSQEAAFLLWELGYEHVRSLVGGIDRWAAEVDSSLPRY